MNSSNPTSLNLTCQKNELAESKLTGWTNSLNFHPPNLHEFVRFDKFVCSMRCDSTSWDWRVRIRLHVVSSLKVFLSMKCSLDQFIFLKFKQCPNLTFVYLLNHILTNNYLLQVSHITL